MIFPFKEVVVPDEKTLTTKHVVSYKVIRPWLRVLIFNPANPKVSFPAMCLADTGSDITFLNTEIGEYLGYKISEGKLITIHGVGGGEIKGYFFEKVGIILNDPRGRDKPIMFEDTMGFVEGNFPLTSPEQTGVLGTEGFFRNVDVYFRYPKEIVVTPTTFVN